MLLKIARIALSIWVVDDVKIRIRTRHSRIDFPIGSKGRLAKNRWPNIVHISTVPASHLSYGGLQVRRIQIYLIGVQIVESIGKARVGRDSHATQRVTCVFVVFDVDMTEIGQCPRASVKVIDVNISHIVIVDKPGAIRRKSRLPGSSTLP